MTNLIDKMHGQNNSLQRLKSWKIIVNRELVTWNIHATVFSTVTKKNEAALYDDDANVYWALTVPSTIVIVYKYSSYLKNPLLFFFSACRNKRRNVN